MANFVSASISLRSLSKSSSPAPTFLSQRESTMPCITLKPRLSATLAASMSTFLSQAQTPMCASMRPNFALA